MVGRVYRQGGSYSSTGVINNKGQAIQDPKKSATKVNANKVESYTVWGEIDLMDEDNMKGVPGWSKDYGLYQNSIILHISDERFFLNSPSQLVPVSCQVYLHGFVIVSYSCILKRAGFLCQILYQGQFTSLEKANFSYTIGYEENKSSILSSGR